MAGIENELIGGPLDGRRITVQRRHRFLWIDDRPGGLCFRNPKPHRVLYEAAKKKKGQPSVYVYAGHVWSMCSGCLAYHKRVEDHVCTFCGGELAVKG